MRSSKIRFDLSTIDVPHARCHVPGVRCRVSGIEAAAAGIVLGLVCLTGAYGQETQGQEIQSPEKAHRQVCPDPPPQTSGSHGFRRVGETIDIPINVADCQPVAFVVRWSNGRSNGTSLVVTFLDSMNQPIHSRALSGFLSGSFEFSLRPSIRSRGLQGDQWSLCPQPSSSRHNHLFTHRQISPIRSLA